MLKTRNTNRKRIIQAMLAEAAGTPIVLEELRWCVMRKELAEEKEPVTAMSEAYQKSFNRTLRTFLLDLAPGLSIHRIASGWTAGLLARVAVYRLDQVALLDTFLACPSCSLHCWTNSRTADVWDEVSDGEVEVKNEQLFPADVQAVETEASEPFADLTGGDAEKIGDFLLAVAVVDPEESGEAVGDSLVLGVATASNDFGAEGSFQDESHDEPPEQRPKKSQERSQVIKEVVGIPSPPRLYREKSLSWLRTGGCAQN
ncbi:MAG TPA: hypothetical protein VMG10_15475 [Gemmataceae bacterium]|nr:hypothetical protein [Gemmataceae bacterium]